MHVRDAAFRSFDRPHRFQAALLASVSALTLFAAAPAEARNILAMGGGNSAVATASAAALASAQQAAAAALQAQNSLTRATQAIQAMQAAQSAAHNLALSASNSVPNGLMTGGLVVDPRVTAGTDPNLWQNISRPVQTTSNGQTTVTLTQASQRAVATWEQFNVGTNTTVDFDQSGGNSTNGNNWVVLNRIDATGSPSHILGSIVAQGTVLLIDPNGIIFGGSSQVNTHALIAAAMDLNSYTNSGVFLNSNTGGNYVPVAVSGVAQVAASGTPLLAPPNEDNGNAAFLANGLYINNSSGQESLVFSVGVPGSQTNQGVVVQPGAVIATNVSGFDNGGLVALLGPSVTNNGAITAPAGQIILAGSPTLWLTEPNGSSSTTDVAVTSAGIGGMYGPALAWYPSAIPGGAVVTNDIDGLLTASRGNITLVGDLVNQLGAAEATTSITRAGTIDVWANQQLTFGPNSVTAILPDENSETIPQNSVSTFVPPSIAIDAANMDVQGTAGGAPGALIVAPGATMTVATTTPYNGSNTTPTGRVLLESGSVIDLAGLDATASVADYLYTFKVTANDVADTPLAQNLIGQTVTIDLALSGTRSDGLTWVGSPLFASSGAGYLGDISQSIGQLLTKGGSLTFTTIGSPVNSNNPFIDVLQEGGSIINVSGGALTLSGGTIDTTMLLSSDGHHIYNIGAANPFMSNDGVAGSFTVDHPHWGVTETYVAPLLNGSYYEPGYVDGISGGSLTVSAVNPVLEGAIIGATQTGTRQDLLAQSDTGANGTQATPDQLPAGAALSITTVPSSSGGDGDAVLLQSQPGYVLGTNFTMSSTLTLPTIDLVSGLSPAGNTTTAMPQLIYSTDILSAADFGSITISSSSALSMAQGAVLTVQPGGSIKLGGVTSIDGTLNARSGSITLVGFTNGTFIINAPPTPQVTIGPDALFNVSGLWVNDTGATGDAIQGPAHINGGSVTVETYAGSTADSAQLGGLTGGSGLLDVPVVDTTQGIVLTAGSVIDVSGGGYVQPNGQLQTASSGLPAGSGGNLSLLTYVRNSGNNNGWANPFFNFGANYSYPTAGNIGPFGINPITKLPNEPNQANVVLDGTIYSGGLGQGGTFALQVPIVQIGGVAAVTSYTAGADTGEVALPASFFSTNGFSTYALTSTYGNVTVAAGTTVLLQQKNYVLPAGSALPASGAELRDFAALGLAPLGERQPVNLTLTELSYVYGGASDISTDAGIIVASGATILGEPGAAIQLTAAGSVTVLGSITAPGGSIALTNDGASVSASGVSSGNNYYGYTETQAPLDIWIGAQAVLDVSGVFVPDPLVTTYATGTALAGGSITLSGGVIVAMPGSSFDFAGTSATVDMPNPAAGLSGTRVITAPVWSNGGSLALSGNTGYASGAYNSVYFDGTIDAAGGAPSASGGTLAVGTSSGDYGAAYSAIIIPQTGEMTAAFNGSALSGAYPATFAQLQNLLPNTKSYAYITGDRLNGSGLSSVTLFGGTIAFSGNVTVNVPGALTLAGNLTLLPTGNVNPSDTAASIGATVVNLDAGYLLLLNHTSATPTLSDGTLNLAASAQLDLAGWSSVSNAANVNLSSGGDIRLLSDADAEFAAGLFESGSTSYFGALFGYFYGGTAQSMFPAPGMLVVPDNLTLTAREVYPSTDSAFLLMSTGLATGRGTIDTITIASNGAAPVAPLSVDGEILIDAKTIVQAGVLSAPLGTIELGLATGQTIPSAWTSTFSVPAAVTTQSLVLAAGSLTSVSAAGLDLPYGTTVNDTNWSAMSAFVANTFADGSTFSVMTAPPAKAILLNGATIDSQVGAAVDLSGGGDIYATEFVPGTGGSRNVLAGAGSGQAVYALVPGYAAPVAATDSVNGTTVPLGLSVTLAGGNGIAAGTYTLMPAIYATMPGAYRVVVLSSSTSPASVNEVLPDGSIYMTGALGNAITGARSPQTALLEIQPDAVWTKYSEIDITPANSYFAKLAAASGTATPPLPIDGGTLTVNATTALTLEGSYDFAPAADGRGGEVAITATNLLVLAPDMSAPAADAGYVVLSSDQISDLGAGTVLIGGTFSQESNGTLITPTAANLVVDTDAAHPLAASDLMLVAAPTATSTQIPVDDPNYYGDTEQVLAAGTPGAITVLAGSVIKAVGTASSGTVFYLGQNQPELPATESETDIENNWWQGNPLTTFYQEAYSGALAALLQVSNGSAVVVQRGAATQPLPTVTTIDDYYSNYGYPTPADPFAIPLPALAPVASISIGAGAVISGGNALTINGGNVTMGSGATISANNVTLAGSVINLGDAPSTAPGLTLSSAIVAQLAGTQSVTLQSASVFNLYDGGGISFGTAANPIGTLTLDGAGLYSNGGSTTIDALNVVFTDSQSTPNTAGALSGAATGTLTVDAGVSNGTVFGPGSATLGATPVPQTGDGFTFGNFAQVNVNASQAIVFADSGSLGAGAAAVTLTAPAVVAAAGSKQSFTTAGTLTLLQGTGTAPTLSATDIGGSLDLTGAAIADSGTITALAGSVTLTAASGDVVLSPDARILATGSHIVLFDATEDAAGGSVQLIADSGNVIIDSGARVDVSATGIGYAGSISIGTAPTGTATLNGTLSGGAAYGDLGGNFTLDAGSLAGSLPLSSGFTGSFSVALQQGDITIPANTTLTSGQVTLTADDGSVIVNGTIDASGPTGGIIALYGAGTNNGTTTTGGVTIGATAQLLATYRADNSGDPANGNGESTLTQNGGTIILGTTGTPDGSYDTAGCGGTGCGYEQVTAANAGTIGVAAGAILDVSGGAGGANISNNGGQIVLRAPILADGNVNVGFAGTVRTSDNGGPSGDGVVLDAYAVWSTTDGTAGGQHFDGIIDPAGWYYYNANGAVTQIAGTDSTYTMDASSGTTATGDIFTPSAPVIGDHVAFYQTTLVDFVQAPFNSAAIASDFAGASGVSLGSTLHLQPEINLVNPSTTINSGNITVASNWNLGAGAVNTSGTYVPVYRTQGSVDPGEPGMLTLRAVNNVQIDATISDGFYEPNDPFYVVSIPNGVAYEPLSAASSLYGQYSSYTTGADMPGLTGISAPPTAFPSSYNGVDEAVWYGEYYSTYFSLLSDIATLGRQSNSKYITTNAALSGAFDNNPNNYPSYAAYLTAYNAAYVGASYATGESTTSFTANLSAGSPSSLKVQTLTNFDNNPSDYGSYADYTTAYTTYATAMATFIQTYYGANNSYAGARSAYPSTILAPVPPALNAAYAGGGSETAGTYFTDYKTDYASTAYGAYEQYYISHKVEPGDVADNYGSAGTQFWLAALPYLPPIAATPVVAIPTSAAPGPANTIANNPAVNVTIDNLGNAVTLYDYNTTTAASLMTVVPGVNDGSFAYDFVAGAAGISGTQAVNPNAVIGVAAGMTGANANGSVTINLHTTYGSADEMNYFGSGSSVFQYYDQAYQTVDIPTLVRTGTGSITITAAGSFELLDTTAPGAVYTAGAATTSPPVVPLYNGGNSTNGLVSTPTWATNGGAVTITAGADIVGIETPVDDAAGSQTYVANGLTGEFWSAWYYRAGLTSGETTAPFDPTWQNGYGESAQQNTTWINYGTFYQGVGALGGGNVTLKAGADIDDISASLPETIQVSGGLSASGPAAAAHYYGGGDLTVIAGGNLYSSTFYVGRGTGSIRVGGTVAADPANPVTGTATTYQDVSPYQGAYGPAQALPLLLAVQDGFIAITANQSISLGGVFDPTAIPQDLSGLHAPISLYDIYDATVTPADIGATFRSYGPNSGLSLTSLAGDVGIDTLADLNPLHSGGNGETSLFGYDIAQSYASTLSSSTAPATLEARALIGNINLDASQSLIASPGGTIALLAGGSVSTLYVNNAYAEAYNSTLTMLDGTTSSGDGVASLLGAPTPTALSQAWHADDPDPVIIYAGDDITGSFTLTKPAKIEAGRDIINTTLVGENNNAGDITSVIAGRDILATPSLIGGQIIDGTTNFEIYGPGTFFIEAGRNLGPFFTGAPVSGTGIETVGDGSNISTAAAKSYLPVQGASIYALFGVGPGIDYQAAIADYVNPAAAEAGGIDYLTTIAAMLGQTPDQAWATFQALPTTEQDMLIDRAFLQLLGQVGLDYNTPSSPYFHQYARAYETIATLFPARFGYTNNAPSGVNGAAATISTGDLNMAHSLVETQNGGNIAIIGPGGNIDVGANATDSSKPNQEGILTLQGGSILTYTDESALVYQSRIFTEQGGDVTMFSANGDLNAGKGPKSSASYPPLTLIWDVDGYTRVNPAGLVTGAGIGALLSVAGQDPTLSNANLVAPRGTVDAGAAGIRVAGNLNIAALFVANAFNISVGGTATGIPQAIAPNIGALTTASNAAGSAVAMAESVAGQSRNRSAAQDLPSIITVEVIGYGGGDGTPAQDNSAPQNEQRRRRPDQQSYNSNSAFEVLGAGELTDEQKQALTETEKLKFAAP